MPLTISKEAKPGVVVHTSISAVMVTDPHLKSWVLQNIEECARGATRSIEAMRRFPACHKPCASGFGLACSLMENEAYFSFLASNAEGNAAKDGG